MSTTNNKEHSSASTAAWADHKNVDEDTNVNIPSEEAVEDAKEWVEGNEL